MNSNSEIARAVRRALFMSAITAAVTLPAVAQDQDQGEEEPQTITVTGTRIQRQDYVATSPLATVSSEAIKATGQLNTEAVLNTLPQVIPGLSANSNNPADGTATVDLRGLGPTRTLVLVNGRRLNPSVNDGTVDLNNVPTRLIDRVEVVTGGASAVYGSDALAGVVNFILKSDFSGVDIGTQFGQSAQGDGSERQVDLIVGGNFADDRGNLTAFASWYKRDSILQDDRDETRVDFAGGSSTGAPRFDNVAANPFGDPGNYTIDPDGSVRPFNNIMPEVSDDGLGDRYNFAPVNFLLTPAERVNIGAYGHFDLADRAQTYAELLYVDSQNAIQLAPTPATGIFVDADSPLLSADVQALLATRSDPTAPAVLRRRMVEVGARLQENSSKLQQITFGVRGDIGIKNLKYDAYYAYGRTEFDNFTTNDVSRSRLEAGLAGCPAEYVQFVAECVPVNAFGAGNISPAAADFIRLNFSDTLIFERQLVNASLNGNLFTMPAGDVGFAVGVEWREDQSAYRPDQAKQRGDIEGFNAQQPIDGSFDVKEVFVEGLVPLLTGVTGAQSLTLDLGARFSEYSTVGSVTSMKAGLNWTPTDPLLVRAMFQKATRAPSVFELFQSGDQDFPLYADPCAGIDPGGDTVDIDAGAQAFCASAFGITNTAAFVQNNAQIEALNFGNPNLGEETSDTFTIGFAFKPTFAPSLQFSLDYWNIKVDDYINDLLGGAQGIIDACFASADLNSSSCFSDLLNQPLVYRDVSGDLRVNVPQVNASELKTAGIDLQVDYAIPLGWAGRDDDTIGVNLLVSHLQEYELDGIDYSGTIGAYNIQGAFPEWKANLRLSYAVGPVSLAWNTQFIDAMDNQGNIPAFNDGGYVGSDSFFYHDLSASWQATDQVELSLGIRNLTDEAPPVIDNAIDQNGDPSTYDMVGRFWFGGARVTF
jgi:iron complex outermembrane receptor protein